MSEVFKTAAQEMHFVIADCERKGGGEDDISSRVRCKYKEHNAKAAIIIAVFYAPGSVY